VSCALQVADGLRACHRHGLFHGLLKPSEVRLFPDGTVAVLDFGIGFLLTASRGESVIDTMTNANQLASAIDFGSPESLLDPTDRTPLGDHYSLGCVLYFCLAGRYPFPDGSSVEK